MSPPTPVRSSMETSCVENDLLAYVNSIMPLSLCRDLTYTLVVIETRAGLMKCILMVIVMLVRIIYVQIWFATCMWCISNKHERLVSI